MRYKFDEEHPSKTYTIFSYLFSFFVIATIWIYVGSAVTSFLYSATESSLYSCSPLLLYLIQHANFIILLILLILFIYLQERTTLLTFMSDHKKFNFNGFLLGIVVIFLIQIFQTLISILIFKIPYVVHYSTSLYCHLAMFLVALIFTPIQCLSEELLFRSLFYTVAKKTKISAHLISIISALFFTLAHITNVEILSSTTPILILSYYFLSGFFFMEIVFAYKGIEVALGAHIMNNFFITTLVNYTDSSIHSYPFITIGSPNIFIDLFLLIISSSILLFLPSRAKRVVEPF